MSEKEKEARFVVRISTGQPLNVSASEFKFYELIVLLAREKFMLRSAFLTAEARLIGFGFMNDYGVPAA